jgi:transcriptional regulator with XRE-family HTH domain
MNGDLAVFLRMWMLAVMVEHDWNAQQWASKAGTSPTNITRFLNGSDHVPSYKTLAKLAMVAHTRIPTPGIDKIRLPKARKN